MEGQCRPVGGTDSLSRRATASAVGITSPLLTTSERAVSGQQDLHRSMAIDADSALDGDLAGLDSVDGSEYSRETGVHC